MINFDLFKLDTSSVSAGSSAQNLLDKNNSVSKKNKLLKIALFNSFKS